MKYATLNSDGLPTGFYAPGIHHTVPQAAVELTDAQWRECLAHQGRRRIVVADDGRVTVEPYTPPPPSVAEARAARLAEINAACDREMAALEVGYPSREVLTWDKQLAEADALAADPNAPAPLLRGIAQARGIPVEELAARVHAKAEIYTQTSSTLLGKRQALEDRLDAILAEHEAGTLSADEARARIAAVTW